MLIYFINDTDHDKAESISVNYDSTPNDCHRILYQ
jgi:hypothetical protein